MVSTDMKSEKETKSKTPQECPVCDGEWASFPKPPITCDGVHSDEERACKECWEAHLSFQVEERDPRRIECMFCTSIINSRAEVKRLARKGTLIR